MIDFKTLAAASAVAISGASAASAATISVETFSDAAYEAYTLGNTVIAEETFESYTIGSGDFTNTAVGSFETIGGIGSGGSVIPNGDQLAISNDTSFGRVNTTVGGSQWLDSNDTLGILWNAATATNALFGKLAFSLSDAADLGATLTVSANGETLTSFVGQNNSTVDWIVISFAGGVNSAEVSLTNSKLNDGFGIDDVSIAAVPLPAGVALMLTGLGGLAIARRRKAAK